MTSTNSCDAYDELLSGYLDGELTQGDRQRVELHVASCASCQKTYEEMTHLREMSTEEWSKIMNGVTVRTSRVFGWLLYVGGLVLLIGYGSYEFAVDDELPAMVKTGVAAALLGLVLLLASVFRQRVIASKQDKYEDVQI